MQLTKVNTDSRHGAVVLKMHEDAWCCSGEDELKARLLVLDYFSTLGYIYIYVSFGFLFLNAKFIPLLLAGGFHS